jgi:hypothetical protein
MVKRLHELGLVAHEPYRGVSLTGAGRRVALEVIRHHRLLELYLVESLGVPWDRVHQEAEVLEHVLSKELETESLEALPEGARGIFARVSDSDPEMLRYLAARGIAPLAEDDARALTDGEARAWSPADAGPSPLERMLAKGRLRATLSMLGPAFVASIAYVDPGNFATNLQGGAQFGYLLMWVVLLANLMAMLVQYLSAKLGVATDHNLPELVRVHFPRPVTWAMWLQAEVMAMSTDIAEFLGAALGLNLLFGVPLFPAGLLTGVIAFGILELQSRGFRRFELAITALLGIIFAGFLYEALEIGPSAHESLRGLLPGLSGSGSIYLAVGIVGATVMPHVIYLHSALTNGRMPVRNDQERRRVLRF